MSRSAHDKALIASWLDNTHTKADMDKQGILAFLKHWFPEHYNKNWAGHHFDMTKILWEMFRPDKESRLERQGYFIIHREAAKTTLSTFGFPNYFIWLKGYRPWIRVHADGWEGADIHNYDIVQLPAIDEPVIMILSETATQSEYFVMNIRDNINSHTGLRRFFGQKDTMVVENEEDDDSGKAGKIWKRNAFRTNDGTMVVGKGAGQQIRGTNFFGKRPHLVFMDDIYSRNNTKTDTRLKDINRWVFAEVSNSLDSEKGKIFLAGTIVHPDTVLQQVQTSNQWFGLTKPIIDYEELRQILKDHCVVSDGLVEIPSKDKCRELEKTVKTLSWPEKHSLHYVLSLYKREYEQHNIRYFYQEYLNMSEAPEEAKFNRDKLQPVSFGYDHEGILTFTWMGTLWKALAEPVMAVDLASSEKHTADDTVIAVTAYIKAIGQPAGTSNLITKTFPIILHLEGGRGWGIYEDIQLGKVVRKGVVDQMQRTKRRLHIAKYYMEINATQENTRREAAKTLKESVYPIINTQKKIDRIQSTLEPVFANYEVILFEASCTSAVYKFFHQLLALNPTGGHDDYPDTVALAFQKSTINPQAFTFHATPMVSTEQVTSYKGQPYADANDDISKFGAAAWEVL